MWKYLIIALLFVGCAPFPPKPVEIGPVRNITATLVTNCQDEKAEKIINGANAILLPQVGIQVEVDKKITREFQHTDFPEDTLQELNEAVPSPDTDIILGMQCTSPVTKTYRAVAEIVGIPVYGGWVDDDYRRVVWICDMDSRVLAHEIGHLFIFSHVHSLTGLMSPMYLPIIGGSRTLCEKDRDEMLKNKWRDFKEMQ